MKISITGYGEKKGENIWIFLMRAGTVLQLDTDPNKKSKEKRNQRDP